MLFKKCSNIINYKNTTFDLLKLTFLFSKKKKKKAHIPLKMLLHKMNNIYFSLLPCILDKMKHPKAMSREHFEMFKKKKNILKNPSFLLDSIRSKECTLLTAIWIGLLVDGLRTPTIME